MIKRTNTDLLSANWNSSVRILLLVALMLPLLMAVPIAPVQEASAASHVQPALLEMAAQNPDTRVSVIVQKAAEDKGLEQMVSRLGGTVTKDLHIIRAFAAELPAKAIPELAKSNSVRWVSLDAAVAQSSGPAKFTTWATENKAPASASIAANFNGTSIPAGKYIWFNSVMSASGLTTTRPINIYFDS